MLWLKERFSTGERKRKEKPTPVLYIGNTAEILGAGEYRIFAERSDDKTTKGWGPFRRRKYDIKVRVGTGDPSMPIAEHIWQTEFFRNGREAQRIGRAMFEALNG